MKINDEAVWMVKINNEEKAWKMKRNDEKGQDK